ncbi:aspartate transcarbamylase [Reticulomyxa filosa]|uniref:Aspartate transcarbamylase n=1 Tax=Reticulomyxa filosa TaxID=46433 RepID=X6LCV0_RETFI|nr:aspartate transcarbamylase [Reticulomyxa filosa]|eukprot:ETN98916.1 aspartate transcarbamylase [Reticulomyxa filosa]
MDLWLELVQPRCKTRTMKKKRKKKHMNKNFKNVGSTRMEKPNIVQQTKLLLLHKFRRVLEEKKKEFLKRIDDMTVTFIGDLKYGMMVHSLVQTLFKFRNVKKSKLIGDEGVKKHNNIIVDSEEITQTILQNTDVMYVTRIQKERFSNSSLYEKFKGKYFIDNSLPNKCKSAMILVHPSARVGEITTECDDNHRAKYFQR